MTTTDFTSYPVPAPTTALQDVETYAGLIEPGDELLGTDGARLTVHSVRFGTKYATLYGPTGNVVHRLPREDAVTVQRLVETPESREARQLAETNKALLAAADSHVRSYSLAAAKLGQKLVEGGMLSYHEHEELLTEQATAQIWGEFLERVARDPNQTPVQVRSTMVQRFTREIMEGWAVRSLSKSTSVMSNLLDEVMVEAKVTFCRDARNR